MSRREREVLRLGTATGSLLVFLLPNRSVVDQSSISLVITARELGSELLERQKPRVDARTKPIN
jgi:hypothetical protein